MEEQVVSNSFTININKGVYCVVSNSFTININKGVYCVVSNSFTININKYIPVESITIPTKDYALNIEDTIKIDCEILPLNATNKVVKWTSSDEKIAKVDSSGVVTPLRVGDVVITATSEDCGKFDSCNIAVVELKPSISDVVVSNVDSKGNYKLTYSLANMKENVVHKLKIGNQEYLNITPSQNGNIYSYEGSGLDVGEYLCLIEVTDGYTNLTSNAFRITVSEEQEGMKHILKQAKELYDSSHKVLKITIGSIIDDGIFDQEVEGELLNNAIDEYNNALTNLNTVSQQCIDFIAQKKANDVGADSKKLTEAYVQILSDSISLKVGQTEYDENNVETSNKFSEIKQTTESISLEVSKKVGQVEMESFVEQSADSLKIKFEQSGGYNYLLNSDFRRGLEKWSTTGSPIIDKEVDCPNGVAVKMIGEIGKTVQVAQYGVELDGTSSETFTASYYTYVSSKGSNGTTNAYRRGEFSINYTDGTTTWHGLPNVSKFDTWEKVSITVKPQKRATKLNLTLLNRDTSKIVYYSACMIEKGELTNDWSPNPNEIYSGITSIDKDGIIVSSTKSETYTKIDSESFRVETKTNGTIAEFGVYSDIPDIKSSVINTENIYAGNIITTEPVARSVYVDMTNGNDKNTGSSSSQFKTIQTALGSIGKYFHDARIRIIIKGTGKQDIRVQGFNGSGVLEFYLENGTRLHTNLFDIRECTVFVEIRGNDTWSSSVGQIIQSDTGSCIVARSITYLEVFNLCMVGAKKGDGHAVSSTKGSNVYINNCEISRFNSCVRAESKGRVSLFNTKGSDIDYLATGNTFGEIFFQKGAGIIPNATYDWNSSGYSIYEVKGLGTGCTRTNGTIYPPTSTTPPPIPPPPTTTNTKTWNFNKIWSDETLNLWPNKNELIQGYASKWDTGRWTGYMQMADDFADIRTSISGATNLSGRLYVQRRASSGNSTGSKLCLYASNGDMITTDTTIDRGKGVWINLNSSTISKIQSGAIKYFYLKADSNNAATYFKCESNAKIEITYTK